MLKIENLDKLKITSITAVIHFKYDNKDYCKKHIQDLKKELGGVLSERK